MRNDAVGFFWENHDEKTQKKENFLKETGWIELRGKWYKQGKNPTIDYTKDRYNLEDAYLLEKKTFGKAVPPEPTWLEPDYLPHYDIAKNYQYDILTDFELMDLVARQEPFVFDIECYVNYFLIAFKNYKHNKIIYFESFNDSPINLDKLKWFLENALLISFNGDHYDIPIATLAVNGFNNEKLKEATDDIILWNMRSYQLLKKFKCKKLKVNHIDIKEVAPLSASLKIYGGRVNSQRMQDLPFEPQTVLSEEQAVITKWYCINDLDTTEDLRSELAEELLLRYNMSKEYQTDLRSKSDAQIAEAVISITAKRITNVYPKAVPVQPGTVFKYDVPRNIEFQSELLNWVLDIIKNANFVIGEDGKVQNPKEIKELKFTINETEYNMGIGGLHSIEKKISHFSNEYHTIIDRDIASNYPRIILNQGLFPPSIGELFLQIYSNIVETRLKAKREKRKTIANSLKIVINGAFGKFGSQYSVLYAPKLMLQTTISGQLYLLMLIEMLELNGVTVVSANTDGVVFKMPNDRKEEIDNLIKEWEQKTSFESEETIYKSLHSRDVNNYIAVQPDLSCKLKGIFKEPGLHKNPTCNICSIAVVAYLTHGAAIASTVMQHQRVEDFVAVRTVKGGAVKDGEFLGKAIRWYYSNETDGSIIYAKTGNRVAKSEGAKPLMELPQTLPKDIDYNWYIEEAYKMLESVGLD